MKIKDPKHKTFKILTSTVIVCAIVGGVIASVKAITNELANIAAKIGADE